MRSAAIVLVLLLVAPAGAALELVPRAPALEIPGDISDGDLLMLLAPLAGHEVRRVPLLGAPTEDVATLAHRLAERRGVAADPADFAMFHALHPDVALPVATLLTAMDQAWALRDEAFAGVAREDILVAIETSDPTLVQPTNPEALIAAAILLLDTAESVAIPQLEAAAQSGAWPATAIADPVGVLRIGGTGNDTERVHRILQIDARGDDTYLNNAGGAQSVNDLRPSADDYPVAMHIDLAGNDTYRFFRQFAIGGAAFGVGIAIDAAGNDSFSCGEFCMGGDLRGVGIFRDANGNDIQRCYDLCLGGAVILSLARDDFGSDSRDLSGGLGTGFVTGSLGIFWDRESSDVYGGLSANTPYAYGGSDFSGFGLFADEGVASDSYTQHSLVCNSCDWRHGIGPRAPNSIYGFGSDGTGAMARAAARLVSALSG